jgi:hypothetical protein
MSSGVIFRPLGPFPCGAEKLPCAPVLCSHYTTSEIRTSPSLDNDHHPKIKLWGSVYQVPGASYDWYTVKESSFARDKVRIKARESSFEGQTATRTKILFNAGSTHIGYAMHQLIGNITRIKPVVSRGLCSKIAVQRQRTLRHTAPG